MSSRISMVLIGLAACGTTAGAGIPGVPDAPAGLPDAASAPPDAAAPREWPLLVTPGRSAARVLVSPSRAIVLEETLTGFDQIEPGPRRLRSIDRSSFAERIFAPSATSRIADAALHPSGALSVAVVDEARHISLVRLDEKLAPVAETPLVDPLAATDPIIGDNPGDSSLRASGATGDSVRVAVAGEDLVVAVFTSRNSVILYRLRLVEAGWTVTWRTLVEPAMGLTPFLPIGGSFDTFGAIVAWFRPSLATDGQENAYVAIWAGQRRIPAHVTVFDDSVEPLPHDPDARDSDVLLSKIDASGARRWTRVVGTRFEDEPYALAASGNQAVVVGRSRANPGNDSTRWDAWLAAVDGEGTLIASRTLPFDASGIFLGVAIDAEGGIVTGGSDGWNQNPDGLSILDYGAKLLVTLPHADGPLVRVAVPAGPRHNEIRSVAASPDGLWYAGHEDGPITHSGDADPGQIHATGVVGAVPVER